MREMLLNLSEKRCPVDGLLRYVKGHRCLGCGKCVFGYEGAAQLELTLTDITMKKSRSGDLAQLEKLCRMMAEQSLCGDGTELGRTALAVFGQYASAFSEHVAKRACQAGVCRSFVTYHILADRCVGCGECLDACEDDAILGKKKFIHVIDQDECTQCGRCLDACEEEAIVKAGPVKPRCPAKPIPCKR